MCSRLTLELMPALLSRFFLIPIWCPGKSGEIFDHGWHEMMRMTRLRLGYGGQARMDAKIQLRENHSRRCGDSRADLSCSYSCSCSKAHQGCNGHRGDLSTR